MTAGTHNLGLWSGEPWRTQPRDRLGRFVRVRHTPQQRKVLGKAAEIRAALGLPADPRLTIRVEP